MFTSSYNRITHVVVDLTDLVEQATFFLYHIGYGSKISAKVMVEYMLIMGQTDTMDINYWDYLEATLSPEDLDAVNPEFLCNLITLIFGNIEKEIKNSLGLDDPGSLCFLRWIGYTSAVFKIAHGGKYGRDL